MTIALPLTEVSGQAAARPGFLAAPEADAGADIMTLLSAMLDGAGHSSELQTDTDDSPADDATGAFLPSTPDSAFDAAAAPVDAERSTWLDLLIDATPRHGRYPSARSEDDRQIDAARHPDDSEDMAAADLLLTLAFPLLPAGFMQPLPATEIETGSTSPAADATADQMSADAPLLDERDEAMAQMASAASLQQPTSEERPLAEPGSPAVDASVLPGESDRSLSGGAAAAATDDTAGGAFSPAERARQHASADVRTFVHQLRTRGVLTVDASPEVSAPSAAAASENNASVVPRSEAAARASDTGTATSRQRHVFLHETAPVAPGGTGAVPVDRFAAPAAADGEIDPGRGDVARTSAFSPTQFTEAVAAAFAHRTAASSRTGIVERARGVAARDPRLESMAAANASFISALFVESPTPLTARQQGEAGGPLEIPGISPAVDSAAAPQGAAHSVQMALGVEPATTEKTMTAEPSTSAAPLPNEPAIAATIVRSMHVQYRDGVGTAVVQLDPEYLGGVTVKLQVQNGNVTATLHAANSEVRAWLEANDDMLRQGLAEKGLALHRLIVADTRAEDSLARDSGRQQPQEPPRRRRLGRRRETATFEVVV